MIELRRRRAAGLLLLVPVAVLAAALAPRLSPYAGAKLLVVLSPAVCLMAAIGALSLLAQRARGCEDRRGRRAGRAGGRNSHHRRPGLPGGHAGATRARRGDGGRGRPRRGRRALAGERVGGVQQVLHARHQGQRRLRGRVAATGGDARSAPDLRALLRPRRADAALRAVVPRHHQAPLARGQPAARQLPAGLRERLLRGVAARRPERVVEHLRLQRLHRATDRPVCEACRSPRLAGAPGRSAGGGGAPAHRAARSAAGGPAPEAVGPQRQRSRYRRARVVPAR